MKFHFQFVDASLSKQWAATQTRTTGPTHTQLTIYVYISLSIYIYMYICGKFNGSCVEFFIKSKMKRNHKIRDEMKSHLLLPSMDSIFQTRLFFQAMGRDRYTHYRTHTHIDHYICIHLYIYIYIYAGSSTDPASDLL